MARPKADDHWHKRRAILNSAAEVIARHGYDGASMAMIAKACGVSKALFYHYWKDKADLVFDVLAGHLNGLCELARGVHTTARPPREKLELLAFLLLDAYQHADAVHQVQLSCLRLLPPERQEMLKRAERELVEHAGSIIGQLHEVAAAHRTLRIPLTMSFFAMLNWHHLWHREGRGLDRHDYAKMVAALIADGTPGAIEALRQATPLPTGPPAPS